MPLLCRIFALDFMPLWIGNRQLWIGTAPVEERQQQHSLSENIEANSKTKPNNKTKTYSNAVAAGTNNEKWQTGTSPANCFLMRCQRRAIFHCIEVQEACSSYSKTAQRDQTWHKAGTNKAKLWAWYSFSQLDANDALATVTINNGNYEKLNRRIKKTGERKRVRACWVKMRENSILQIFFCILDSDFHLGYALFLCEVYAIETHREQKKHTQYKTFRWQLLSLHTSKGTKSDVHSSNERAKRFWYEYGGRWGMTTMSSVWLFIESMTISTTLGHINNNNNDKQWTDFERNTSTAVAYNW